MTRSRDILTRAERGLVDEVLRLYRHGWFPMNDQDGRVRWVQPGERGIIPLDNRFHISGTLRARVRSGRYTITTDRAFGAVIRACAAPAKGRDETWLDDSIINAFELLHRAGHAHSIEAWRPGASGDVLVGGLYGLVLGSVFCGESMFSRPALGGTDASKVCLVHLVGHLRRRGFVMLDAQMMNEHLERFGCYAMPREDYLRTVEAHAAEHRDWPPFEPERTRAEV